MDENKINDSFLTTEAKTEINRLLNNGESGGSLPNVYGVIKNMSDASTDSPSYIIPANGANVVGYELKNISGLNPNALYAVINEAITAGANGCAAIGISPQTMVTRADENGTLSIVVRVIINNYTNTDITISTGTLSGSCYISLMECNSYYI